MWPCMFDEKCLAKFVFHACALKCLMKIVMGMFGQKRTAELKCILHSLYMFNIKRHAKFVNCMWSRVCDEKCLAKCIFCACGPKDKWKCMSCACGLIC